jgi:hypothetical protein
LKAIAFKEINGKDEVEHVKGRFLFTCFSLNLANVINLVTMAFIGNVDNCRLLFIFAFQANKSKLISPRSRATIQAKKTNSIA